MSGSSSSLDPKCLSIVVDECPNLEYLNISKMDVSNSNFRVISKLKKLKELNVSYCSRITDVSLAKIFQHCKLMETLDITFCHLIVGECFARSTEALKNLTIDQCERVTSSKLLINIRKKYLFK